MSAVKGRSRVTRHLYWKLHLLEWGGGLRVSALLLLDILDC